MRKNRERNLEDDVTPFPAQTFRAGQRPENRGSTARPGKAITEAAAGGAAIDAMDDPRPLADESSKQVLNEFFRGYDSALGMKVLEPDAQSALRIISLMAEFDGRLALTLRCAELAPHRTSDHSQSVCVQAQECLAIELAETREGRLREAETSARIGESRDLAPHKLWRDLKLTGQEQRALMFGPARVVCTSWTEDGLIGRFASGTVAGETTLQGEPTDSDYEDLLSIITGRHVYLLDEQGATIIYREGDEIVRPRTPEIHDAFDFTEVARYQGLLRDPYYGARTVCIPLLAALPGLASVLPLAVSQLAMLREHKWLEFSGISGNLISPRLFWFNCWHDERVLFSPGDPAKLEPDLLRFLACIPHGEIPETLSFDVAIVGDSRIDRATALAEIIETWQTAQDYFHELVSSLVTQLTSNLEHQLLLKGEQARNDAALQTGRVFAAWKKIKTAIIALVQSSIPRQHTRDSDVPLSDLG